MLEALPQLLPSIELHEWHLSPVLDAQCRTGDFAGAIATLQRMAERGITLVAGVAAALQRRAAASASHLAAARAALESAPRVPRAALHALLYAAAQRRDAASAEAMYAAVCAPGRGALVPSAETHEARLLACLEAGDWAAGERAWAEAAERGTPLSAVAYERMARLALRQETYEEAFRRSSRASCPPGARMRRWSGRAGSAATSAGTRCWARCVRQGMCPATGSARR